MSIATYSPKDTLFTICDSHLVGWNSITIAPNTSAFNPVMGIRGKHSRIKSLDSSAIVTLSLPQASEWNDILSQIVILDSTKGTGRLEIQLKNSTNGIQFSSTEAFIVNYSPLVYSGTMNYREWKIHCLSTTTFSSQGEALSLSALLNSAVSGLTSLF